MLPTEQRKDWHRSMTSWLSTRIGWLTAGAILGLQVPLFLAMPPWCDLTLYIEAAHAIRHGGIHYQDVFDTNPPGFVVTLALWQSVCGESVLAARCLDLLIVVLLSAGLLQWVRWAGGTPASVAWTAAAWAWFYPSLSEFCHVQRDTWMLLPVLAALLLRVQRIHARDFKNPCQYGIVEGLLIGLACWVKPHALLPAIAVWLVTARPLARQAVSTRRAIVGDLLGYWLGGLAALGVGIMALRLSGSWAGFWEVFTFWNPGYLKLALQELPGRWPQQWSYFPPWGWLQPLVLICCVVSLFYRQECPARRALAMLTLAWIGQALILQRALPYAHVPEVFLGLACLAAFRLPVALPSLILMFALGLDGLPAERRALWWSCWQSSSIRLALQDALAREPQHFAAIHAVELAEVAAFLQAQNPPPADGEVLAWHDGTHPIYRMLDVRPAVRFQHLSTVMGIGPAQYEQVRREVAAARPRWVVADLGRVTNPATAEGQAWLAEPGDRMTDPPASMQRLYPNLCQIYPWRGKSLFRSAGGRGRYVVLAPGPMRAGESCWIPQALAEDAPAPSSAGILQP